MPKAAERRQINGCIRRGPLRNHASNTRSMHLGCEEVLYRQFLQKCMFVHGGAACSALLSMPTLIVLYTYILQGVLTSTIPSSAILIQCLLQIQMYRYIKITTLLHDGYVSIIYTMISLSKRNYSTPLSYRRTATHKIR